MLALGLLLNTVGIGLFCWLIFTLAVYALPFFVAINAGIWAFHSGAGVLGTPLVAVAAGGMSLAIAQIAFAMTRSPILRAIIAAVFALPATFAGYHVVLAMAQIGVPSLVWREVFACVGAVFIGGTAWTRLAVLQGDPTGRTGQGGRRQSLSQFSRPPRERDDLFTLVGRTGSRRSARRGVRDLSERTSSSSSEHLDRRSGSSPAPYRRGRTFFSGVVLGQTIPPFPALCFFLFAETFQTSCTS